MILSANQLFSNKQAVTATARSENVIDTGVRGTPYGGAAALNGDIGKGNPICLLVQVTEEFATLTSLTIGIETGAADTLGTELASQTILLAGLTAGTQLNIQFVPNGAIERYLGVRYTVGGSNATAGTITAGISMGNQTNTTGA
jgi:hypothetical protein